MQHGTVNGKTKTDIENRPKKGTHTVGLAGRQLNRKTEIESKKRGHENEQT